jgi:hypothetical protein
MKEFLVEQGSPEWHQARAGVLTASNMKIARQKVNCLDAKQQNYVDAVRRGLSDAAALAHSGYKAKPTSELVARALRGEKVGEPSSAALNLAFRLAIERIAGEPLQDDRFETYAMRRGHELEPEARKAHEKLGVVVRRVGFVTTDDGRIGASLDGLIDPNGASEYKCLTSPEGLREILVEDDLSEFVDQMQTGIMVCERDYFHFGLYCPALEPIGREFTLRVVTRNDFYIRDMRREADEFLALVDGCEFKLRNGGEAEAAYLAKALA